MSYCWTMPNKLVLIQLPVNSFLLNQGATPLSCKKAQRSAAWPDLYLDSLWVWIKNIWDIHCIHQIHDVIELLVNKLNFQFILLMWSFPNCLGPKIQQGFLPKLTHPSNFKDLKVRIPVQGSKHAKLWTNWFNPTSKWILAAPHFEPYTPSRPATSLLVPVGTSSCGRSCGIRTSEESS